MIRLYNLAVGKSGKPAMRPLPLEYASIEAMLASFQAVSLDAQQAMGGDMQALPENVFYSVAHVEVGKERSFISQDILALDIDKVTEAEAERVLQVTASCLGVPSLEACAGVFSGHGVHLLLPLKKIATDVSWFSKYREHFKYLCQEVNQALKTAGLNGEADPTSFGRGKVFRLPGTVNKKPGKDPVECVLLRPVTARWGEFRFDFDEFAETTKFSGPDNSKHDYISDHVLKQFPK